MHYWATAVTSHVFILYLTIVRLACASKVTSAVVQWLTITARHLRLATGTIQLCNRPSRTDGDVELLTRELSKVSHHIEFSSIPSDGRVRIRVNFRIRVRFSFSGGTLYFRWGSRSPCNGAILRAKIGRRSTFPDMSSSGYSQSDLAGGTMVCMPIGLY